MDIFWSCLAGVYLWALYSRTFSVRQAHLFWGKFWINGSMIFSSFVHIRAISVSSWIFECSCNVVFRRHFELPARFASRGFLATWLFSVISLVTVCLTLTDRLPLSQHATWIFLENIVSFPAYLLAFQITVMYMLNMLNEREGAFLCVRIFVVDKIRLKRERSFAWSLIKTRTENRACLN